MKAILVCLFLAFLTACANEPGDEAVTNPAPTKAELKAREDFASTLPKPRDR